MTIADIPTWHVNVFATQVLYIRWLMQSLLCCWPRGAAPMRKGDCLGLQLQLPRVHGRAGQSKKPSGCRDAAVPTRLHASGHEGASLVPAEFEARKAA